MKTINIHLGFREYFDEIYIFALYLAYFLKEADYDVSLLVDSLPHPFAQSFTTKHNIKLNVVRASSVEILLDKSKKFTYNQSTLYYTFFLHRKQNLKPYKEIIHKCVTPQQIPYIDSNKQLITYFGLIETTPEKHALDPFTQSLAITYSRDIQNIIKAAKKYTSKTDLLLLGDNLVHINILNTFKLKVVFPFDIKAIADMLWGFVETDSNIVNHFLTLNMMNYGIQVYTFDEEFNKQLDIDWPDMRNFKEYDLSKVSVLSFDNIVEMISKDLES